MAVRKIRSPESFAVDELCAQLATRAPELDRTGQWPAEQLRLCAECGVFEWFLDRQWGGQGWNQAQVVRGYLALSASCLTTAFIITQRTGACKRIAGCENESLKQRLLPGLASGELFATVGISHLTTSRRHVARPVLVAERIPGGFRLTGMSPWVTGAAAADVIVMAATMASNGESNDEQLLIAVPRDLSGLAVPEPLPLVGVSASSTGPVHLDHVEVSDDWLIAGPMRHVMASGVGAGTGGYETSTLALGAAHSSIDFLETEAAKRADLQLAAAALRREHQQLLDDLLAVVEADRSLQNLAEERPASKESIRQRANSLVLRTSQAALAAAKGSGYVIGHPAGRWCREALFFLVWSCPQPVAVANLCELAGIED